MKVLMIGADPSFRDNQAKVDSKFSLYKDLGHELTFVDLITGNESNFQSGNIKFYCFGGTNKLTTFLNNLRGLKSLKKEGQTFDVITSQDLVYTGLLGLFACRLFGCELVPQVHGDYVDNALWLGQSPFRQLENRIAKFVIKKVKFIRTVSARINKDLDKYTKDKIVISSPIGTSFKSYYPQNPLPNQRNKQLLFVGRLIEEKNPYLFCEVSKRVLQKDNEFKIAFAGSGILERDLQSWFKDNNLQDCATFFGQCDSDKLRTLYQNSLCYVHTALWEGWGMPMVEAAATGCPVVTTDSGCVGEAILDNIHGFVCPPDSEKFADKILELAQSSELQKTFSENGIRDCKNWELEHQTKIFINLLQQAAKK